MAKEAIKLGAKVTLVLGPVSDCCLNASIRIIRFRFFDELRKRINKELSARRYDLIIHSAAVSDFQPHRVIRGKIHASGVCNLELKPLPKIIGEIRRLAPKAKSVMFKLESGVSDVILLERAKKAQAEVGTDLVVANRLNPYRAFIINKEGNAISVKSKNILVKRLLRLIPQL